MNLVELQREQSEKFDRLIGLLQTSRAQGNASASTGPEQSPKVDSPVKGVDVSETDSVKLKMDKSVCKYVSDLDVCSDDHILPLVFKTLMKLCQKESLPDSALIAIATPHRPPATTKGAKVKRKSDGKFRLEKDSPPMVAFEYIGRVVVSSVITDLPAPDDNCNVTEQYTQFRSKVRGWKAQDPLTRETKYLFSLYRGALVSFRSKTRALLRDTIGALVSTVDMGGSEDLCITIASPTASQFATPKSVDEAIKNNMRDNERFSFEAHIRYNVIGKTEKKVIYRELCGIRNSVASFVNAILQQSIWDRNNVFWANESIHAL